MVPDQLRSRHEPVGVRTLPGRYRNKEQLFQHLFTLAWSDYLRAVGER